MKPVSKIKIELLKKTEVDTFVRLFKNLVTSQFPEFSTYTKKVFCKNRKVKTLTQLNEAIPIFIATDNTKMIGFLVPDNPVGGVVLCDWIVIEPDYRKNGIGSKLIQEWEKHSKKRGLHNLRLEATKKQLVPFYQKNGFEIIGTDKCSVFGAEAVIMSKIISKPKEKSFFL